MKKILVITLISTFAFSGFYDIAEETDSKKAVYAENERLCKTM